MDICLCGAESGYRHDYACPYPLYRATAAQEDRWLAAREAARTRRRAELQKRPGDGREIKTAEFRRVWGTLEASGACDAWGGVECRRVWAEYLAAGMPEDVADHIRRRANLMADGGEPGTVV